MSALIFHGACFVRCGRIVLALGHSGAGKSFLARTAPGFSLVTDDRVALAPARDGRSMVWEHGASSDTFTGELAAVLLLVRSQRLALTPVSQLRAAKALEKLYIDAAGFAGIERASVARSMHLVWELARSVPCALVENDMVSPVWPMLEGFLRQEAEAPRAKDYWVYSGPSMIPFLRAGDLLVCKTGRPPLRGSVVLFAGARGPAVAHRLVGLRADGSLITRGDAHLRNDRRPVRPEDVLGVVTAVMRDGRVIPLRPVNPELIRLRLLVRKAWGKLRAFLGLNSRRPEA